MSASPIPESSRPIRVLMLGWEYPPRIVGGLGKACSGLSQAMAHKGCQVYFVLPTFPKRIIEKRLHVVGARELLVEAGWPTMSTEITEIEARGGQQSDSDQSQKGQVKQIPVEATLFPYGKSPEGDLPPSVLRMLGETIKRVATKMSLDEKSTKIKSVEYYAEPDPMPETHYE
jgi:hypothetical protein